MAKQQYGSRKKYHFVYKTINLKNERYYIGMHSTNDLNDGYIGSGTYLKRSINRYGKENFKIEILRYCNSREELEKVEKELVNEDLLKDKSCMNLKPGGSGGVCNVEHNKKFTEAGIGKRKWLKENDPEWVKRKSKKTSEVNKKLYSEGKRKRYYFYNWEGKKHRPETIEKMKQSHKGKGIKEQNSQYETVWITNEKESKKIKKEQSIPQGWRLGRKMLS